MVELTKKALNKRNMKKKNVTVAKKTTAPSFDLTSLKPESGINVSIRSQDAREMYEVLDKLEIGQSYKMPISFTRIFTNARVAHKRTTGKVFILRKLDTYNIRCWRVADDTVLVRRTKKKK